MDDPAAANHHLHRLRQWRAKYKRDTSLGFLEDTFKRDTERPHKQLQSIIALWHELVPAELAGKTTLEGLSRGVLRVAVDSSAALYELDHLLRSSLQRELITRHKGTALRRIQLRVAPAH